MGFRIPDRGDAGRAGADPQRQVGGDTAKTLMDRIWAWWVMIGVLALIFTLGATAITVFFALCSVAALREFATITHTRAPITTRWPSPFMSSCRCNICWSG